MSRIPSWRTVAPPLAAIAMALVVVTLLRPAPMVSARPSAAAPVAPSPKVAPGWNNTSWIGADHPVRLAELRGRVVLVNFWVFTCINCKRSIPSLVRFDSLYRSKGLSVIGIHTPEFPPYAGEHDRGNVARAMAQHGIHYPVAQDNDRATWHQYGIRYWPSFVLIDKQGRIRYDGYGEIHVGDQWDTLWESRINALLAEAP